MVHLRLPALQHSAEDWRLWTAGSDLAAPLPAVVAAVVPLVSVDLAESAGTVATAAVVIAAELAVAVVVQSWDSAADAEEDAVVVVHAVAASLVCQIMNEGLSVLVGPTVPAALDTDHLCSYPTSVDAEMAEDNLTMVGQDGVIVGRCSCSDQEVQSHSAEVEDDSVQRMVRNEVQVE